MGTTLSFKKEIMSVSKWNESGMVPFISGISILQNTLESKLEAGDPANVGFGTVDTIYPYTEQNIYTRAITQEAVEVVHLENDYLKATFIPGLGGEALVFV
ncbi:MAG: DUF5107 domain-containing protein [Niameybacter sp.]